MTKGRLDRLLGCLVLGLFVSVGALATGAGAASPESVTITAKEYFPATGDQKITIEATGGVFSALSSGTGESTMNTLGSPTSGGHRSAFVYHGVDVYTTNVGTRGTFTFMWAFTCKYTSATDSLCAGPWHITGGTGAYESAQGGGTALDLCVDKYVNGVYDSTSCDDTLTGKIQVP